MPPPPQVKQHDGEQGKVMIETPNPETFVFARSLVDCGAVADGDEGGTVDLGTDDLHVIRYSSVQALVHADQVCLL